MTREQWLTRVVRAAELSIRVPPGWWGTWNDVTNGVRRVRFAGRVWRVSIGSAKISDHDSRANAIRKAVRL